jgi:ATP-dependent RNA helicase DDX52/ROK1
MDILKLLSRSSKKPHKSSSVKDEVITKLPSAGSSTNPQLFHDTIPVARGKKRKRAAESLDDRIKEKDEEVDFFAPKSANHKSKNDSTVDIEESKRSESSYDAAKLLDYDDCRQILRSHRLKVTLLPASNVQRKVKKSKKAKVDKGAEKKKGTEVYPQPLEALWRPSNNIRYFKTIGRKSISAGLQSPNRGTNGESAFAFATKNCIRQLYDGAG